VTALHFAGDSVTGPTWWAPDGVHPSAAGHGLIADAWLGLVVPRLP
jgi:acyl-CoA thioesterase I